MAGPKTFTQTLNEIDYGALSDELTDKLRELIEATGSPGKAGELSFKLKMKGKNGGRVEVLHDVQLKLPKVARESSIMFVSVEGNLQAKDPNQRELEGMRPVQTGNTGTATAVNHTGAQVAAMPVDVGGGGGAARMTSVG